MTVEIPAEAERMATLLDYPAYRIWWMENVVKLTIPKRRSRRGVPDPAVLDVVDPELG